MCLQIFNETKKKLCQTNKFHWNCPLKKRSFYFIRLAHFECLIDFVYFPGDGMFSFVFRYYSVKSTVFWALETKDSRYLVDRSSGDGEIYLIRIMCVGLWHLHSMPRCYTRFHVIFVFRCIVSYCNNILYADTLIWRCGYRSSKLDTRWKNGDWTNISSSFSRFELIFFCIEIWITLSAR